MIREGKKLPNGILNKIPQLVEDLKTDEDIVALFSFGSQTSGFLKPLSDLDFAILLTNKMGKTQRFDKHIKLIGKFNSTLSTDDVDLVILNDAPLRFSYHIIQSGKLLFCRKHDELIDHIEKTVKIYLDYKFFRDSFDRVFLNGIGYHG
jgi:predicted nucleotidyltransferase